jgi:hypothetical protein
MTFVIGIVVCDSLTAFDFTFNRSDSDATWAIAYVNALCPVNRICTLLDATDQLWGAKTSGKN